MIHFPRLLRAHGAPCGSFLARFTLAFAVTCIVSAPAFAGNVRIENRWKPAEQINVETGAPTSTATKPGWLSAQWAFEPVAGQPYFRIKNAWKGTYLHNQKGGLEAGTTKPGWYSAMWEVEPVAGSDFYKLKNRWTNTYLHNQNGKLELGTVEPGWWSGHWKLIGYTPSASSAGTTAKASMGVSATSSVGKQLLASTGKQCVKAKFGIGYAAKVRWYDPINLLIDPVTNALSIRPGASTYKEQDIAVLQESCVETTKKMVAQVSVIGGKFANTAITIAAGTVVAVASGVAGAVVCVGTAGAGCPAAAAAVGALTSAAASAATAALPDAQETFYVGSPGKLELWGTVWVPMSKETRAFGAGKRAGAACNSDSDCANNTCARESAADSNKSICCPSGREGLYAAHEYCYGMKKGTTCWSDDMCGSGNCRGNASGLQRGTCD